MYISYNCYRLLMLYNPYTIATLLTDDDESLMLNVKLHEVSGNNLLCIFASLKHKAFTVLVKTDTLKYANEHIT